jgi:hypothetical protein
VWRTPTPDAAVRLESLSSGTVLHLKHSDLVLEILDENEEVVYRHPEYRPSVTLAESSR